MRKYVILRLVDDLWNAVHVNIDSMEIANVLLAKLKQEHPKNKFRVVETAERIIYEDK